MTVDSTQALIAQFSDFVASRSISNSEWKIITKEFGVYKIATDTDRFFRSWYFDDDDKALRTANFLESVYEEDSNLAMLLIDRVYDKVGGADEEDLKQYPALRTIDEGLNAESLSHSTVLDSSDQFLNLTNVPESFYPALVEEINSCYRSGAYNATLILSRKLLENSLIDTLRAVQVWY